MVGSPPTQFSPTDSESKEKALAYLSQHFDDNLSHPRSLQEADKEDEG